MQISAWDTVPGISRDKQVCAAECAQVGIWGALFQEQGLWPSNKRQNPKAEETGTAQRVAHNGLLQDLGPDKGRLHLHSVLFLIFLWICSRAASTDHSQ